MSLLNPIRFSKLSREEWAYQAATQPTGFGEYLGAKLKSGIFEALEDKKKQLDYVLDKASDQ